MRQGSAEKRKAARCLATAPLGTAAAERTFGHGRGSLVLNAAANHGRAVPMGTLVAKPRDVAATQARAVDVTFGRITPVGRIVHATTGAGTGNPGKTAAERRAWPFVGDGYADRGGTALVAVRLAIATARGLVDIAAGLRNVATRPFGFGAGTPVRLRRCAEFPRWA